jgi:hypothetical protein
VHAPGGASRWGRQGRAVSADRRRAAGGVREHGQHVAVGLADLDQRADAGEPALVSVGAAPVLADGEHVLLDPRPPRLGRDLLGDRAEQHPREQTPRRLIIPVGLRSFPWESEASSVTIETWIRSEGRTGARIDFDVDARGEMASLWRSRLRQLRLP